MMNKKHIVIITAFCLFAGVGVLHAQVVNSIYSMFGVGQLSDNNFGANRALGGTGIAFQSGSSMNYLNPAAYLGILPNSINMEFGAFWVYSHTGDGSNDQYDSNIDFNYFSASLYISRRWALSFGIVPFSTVGYEVHSSGEVGGDLTVYDVIYSGSGGLSRGYLGNSYRLFKGLNIGLNVSYVLGPITRTETAVGNQNFAGYKLEYQRTVQSPYFDYGVQYSLNRSGWSYTLGLVYAPKTSLYTIDEYDYYYSGSYVESLDRDESDIEVPVKFGVGFAGKKGNVFRAGFDYEWREWSAISFSNANFNTRNSSRYSFGMEILPGRRKSWPGSFVYRFGAKYKNSYMEVDNTPINSIAVNLGVGIPINIKGAVNLGLEYGEEGTLSNGLIKQDYWMLYANVCLSEFWARR